MIIGAYSLFWGILPFSLEIDQTFIGAILTAVLNDVLIVRASVVFKESLNN